MDAQDLLHTDGSSNIGGLQPGLYYAPISDFQTIPELPANPANFGASVTIPDDFIFKTGKCFKEIYLTQGTGGVNDEMVGETDGRSWKNNLKGFHPGTKADMLGFAAFSSNRGFVFLAREADGVVRIIGSKAFPAKVNTGSITTSETPEGRKGFTFEFGCPSPTPAPIYTGTISLTPAL